MPESRIVTLNSGELRLQVERANMPLADLCGFAGRRSRKRGFVFVSKVLGKHFPVRPRVMTDVHVQLALKLPTLSEPVLVIGMAETATGLGQGVYEQLWRSFPSPQLVFLHDTRYRLRERAALQFDERHSHAVDHFLYEPAAADHRELFARAATLILVDDEITTGRTLTNLALAYQRRNSHLRSVHFVCITDWLSAEHRAEIERRLQIPVYFHSLLQGTFTFTANAEFDPGPIPSATGKNEFKDRYLSRNYGRLGVVGPLELERRLYSEIEAITSGEKILVLGTGEFAYPPFLLAAQLEYRGCDVFFQTTTRSPLLVESDLQSVLEFPDNYHDDIPNYVYNVADKHYDRIVICYETKPTLPAHQLVEMLNGQAIYS